jgi:hypothetical protein
MRLKASHLNRAPGLLPVFIEIANSIPPDLEVPDLADLITKGGCDGVALSRAFQKMLDEQFPPRFRKLVGLIKPQTLATAVERYFLFQATRETLRAIAQMPKGSGFLPLPPVGLEQFLEAKIDGEGRIVLIAGPLMEVLRGVEAARIRQCPVCQRIFWAGRKDQPACTKQCTHVLRTRRWRAQYRESYKLQRYTRAEEKARKFRGTE